MTQTRLTFVLQEALGWKVYRTRIAAVAERREDILCQFISVPAEGWQKSFLKRNNMRPVEKLFRWFDPIIGYRGVLGADIRAQIRGFGPSALYLGGHWLSAAIEEMEPKIPFTVATDHTRAAMERDLSRGAWSREDMEREARLFRSAAHVFPMSDWTARSIVEDCGVDPARITVMPPSLDLGRFVQPTYEDHALLRLIFIGNDFQRKGGNRLCEWMAGPLLGKAELHIVSGDPDAAKKGPGVVFHGRVPNDKLVGELLPGMDALCLPTASDMSPLVIIEAAAAGLPVVASRIGAIPELVLEGETGFLLAPDDEVGFIATLERLAADSGLRRRLGTRAWEHAHRNHDANINYNMLIDQLIELGQRKGSPA